MCTPIQSIFRRFYPKFESTHPLPQHVRNLARSIIDCRTPVLGGERAYCPEGHYDRIWYHSCHKRGCPTCSYLEAERWVQVQTAKSLACPHHHVIFTVSHDLNDIWLVNKKTFGELLFHASRDTLLELLGDPKYLGAQPGIVMVLQTWGSDLGVHVHTHCLVTAGGLTRDGTWAQAKKKCLLPRKVAMKVFRGKFREALLKAAQAGELVMPAGMNVRRLKNLLNKLGRRAWNVKILDRYEYADGVVKYLARYVKGGPVSAGRIEGFNGREVSLRCKGEEKGEKIRLRGEEFVRRYLLHTAVPGMHYARSYGVYANTNGQKLWQSRVLLGQEEFRRPEPLRWQEVILRVTGRDPEHCPVCGRELLVEEIPPDIQAREVIKTAYG